MRVKTLLLSVLAIAFVASPAPAQELTGTLKKIKETGTITLGHRDSSVPFSYYDDKQQVVGFAMDLCGKIVEAVKKELKLDKLEVRLNPVTSATRIPLMANGTVDLECGSTTNIKQLNEFNAQKSAGITIIPAKDHAEAFLMVETDRAVAFVMDDILLASLMASAKNPSLYAISSDALSKPEPYGIMLRREDPAFKKVADAAMTAVYKSGEVNAIYDKWFTKPIPPKGINLNLPMSDAFKKVVAKPTASGDPADY